MNTDRHDGCHSRQPGVKGDQERDTWMNAAELGRANEFIQLVGPHTQVARCHTTGMSAFGSELCNTPSAP
ncbi:MAG: hypothetical protein QOG97_520 [Acidimicrobiaceae bacterium]|nr:hypothetical protein [Acidimicrobiaceae bacterium]